MVRRAKTEDVEALAGLAIQMWADHDMRDLTEEFRELILSGEAACFIKYLDKQPIAFAQCQLRYDYVEGTESSPVRYLEGIFVIEEYRKQGYAAELLSECENGQKKRVVPNFQ